MQRAERDTQVRPGQLRDAAGPWIAQKRKAKGWTQEQLRQALARHGVVISRQLVSHHEAGGTMTLEQLDAYAKALA